MFASMPPIFPKIITASHREAAYQFDSGSGTTDLGFLLSGPLLELIARSQIPAEAGKAGPSRLAASGAY
jgi:hypothetical protein